MQLSNMILLLSLTFSAIHKNSFILFILSSSLLLLALLQTVLKRIIPHIYIKDKVLFIHKFIFWRPYKIGIDQINNIKCIKETNYPDPKINRIDKLNKIEWYKFIFYLKDGTTIITSLKHKIMNDVMQFNSFYSNI